MNTKTKYMVTLSDGKTVNVYILSHPVFRCMVSGEGGSLFLTDAGIKERDDIISRDNEPFRLWQPYIGPVMNEQSIFDAYKGLRNPVIKIELMDNNDY